MISRFFIDRPVFANVIAIVTIILGVVAIARLPVERYPPITPPTVVVSASYPGANAKTVADTVAAPIEQQVNGVENMMYMSSTSSADGGYGLTITFNIGTDLDQAQVLVQNRVAIAEPQLPEEVRRQGVTVKKQSSSIILAISLTSPDKTFDGLFLSNYATLRLRDELSRAPGVGEVMVRGVGAYSMRVWLDPNKMASLRITTKDVIEALGRQNVQVAAGQIGQPPNPPGQSYQLTVTTLGRLSEVAQFEGIVLKSIAGGQLVYLRDVARVELGAQTYDSFSVRNGMESANILVYQLPGSNAIEVARQVRLVMERLKPTLPQGMEYSVPFDTTIFVDQAIHEVYWTLGIAALLVLIVILVFLQSWRALLVPATTVPVTIIGAFAFMPLMGFSINLLTLFGLVLAIGIVVDDAIIIVENAMHYIEKGMTPRDATIQAMKEMTGPVLSITCVLMAVFIPTAFMSGITGQMYRQFALTIAATAIISAINALSLKPAQCAAWLKPTHGRKSPFTKIFDAVYRPIERLYEFLVGWLVRLRYLVMLVFVGLLGFTWWLYDRTPIGFLPAEDQGFVIISVQLPDAASLDRTREVVERMNLIFKGFQERGAVKNWFVLGGLSLVEGTQSPNAATAFAAWTDWSERTSPDLSQDALVNQLRTEFGAMKEAFTLVLVPPSIMGLGLAGGFQMQVQDREGAGIDTLQERTQAVIDEAVRYPEIGMAATMSRAGVPQIFLEIERVKAEKMGVLLSDVFASLQANMGSAYVNDFNKFDRTYQVRVQAEASARSDLSQLRRLEVTGRKETERVPLSTLLTPVDKIGQQSVVRYNLYQTASIQGSAAKGVSSTEALMAMERAAGRVLPPSMGFEWTGMSLQERRAGGESMSIFALAVLLVYFVLAALYESWILPLAVILVVPMGLLGVMLALDFRNTDNNIYTQIGIVLIIALASKNAILIVEFARELRIAGRSIIDAAVEASRLRFRPILMTSFAFILGVAPLVWATGAGAAGRQALGTAVFGGMISSTVLAVFFVPVFFVVIQNVIEMISGPPKPIPGEHIHAPGQDDAVPTAN